MYVYGEGRNERGDLVEKIEGKWMRKEKRHVAKERGDVED